MPARGWLEFQIRRNEIQTGRNKIQIQRNEMQGRPIKSKPLFLSRMATFQGVAPGFRQKFRGASLGRVAAPLQAAAVRTDREHHASAFVNKLSILQEGPSGQRKGEDA
jgi:hypothetical protein